MRILQLPGYRCAGARIDCGRELVEQRQRSAIAGFGVAEETGWRTGTPCRVEFSPLMRIIIGLFRRDKSTPIGIKGERLKAR
jgi:hypothetical protein